MLLQMAGLHLGGWANPIVGWASYTASWASLTAAWASYTAGWASLTAHTVAAGPRLLDHYYWSDSNVFKNCKVVCMEMWGLQRKGSLRPQRKLKVGLEFPDFQYPNKAIKGDTLFLFCT